MKEHIFNINKSRREVLKGMMALSASSIFPKFLFSKTNESKTIHFIGLGGAGSNQVEYIFNKGVKGKFTCISNPVRRGLTKEIQFIHFVPPGKNLYNNGNDLLRQSDMSQTLAMPTAILNLFESNDKFILLSGLGSYTGTYMTEFLTLFLQHKKKSFQTFSSMPFSFEGSKKKKLAVNTIQKLKHINSFHYYELDKKMNESSHQSIQDVFKKANEEWYQIFMNHSQS